MTAVTARCRWCERPLRVPSPDGYGPVCRRNLGLAPARTGTATQATRGPETRSRPSTDRSPPNPRSPRRRPHSAPPGQLPLYDTDETTT